MSDANWTEVRTGDHEVPTLNARDMESNVLIGVCGVQAAGKTVFLTSIFHTMTGEDIQGIGHVSFDRHDKGGALYFERIENQIREQGRITPTREPAVARLLVEPPPSAGLGQQEVGVVLFDFAGRYFTEFSDLPRARAAAETPQEEAELNLVNRYLERCNAFIILVDSKNFGHEESAGRQIPFPASISFLLTHCRRRRTPLALVFTKKDENRLLSTRDVEGFEMVRNFKTIFKDDVGGTHPFGFVEHLSCYEIDPDGDVRKQNAEGSIWRREPKQVFTRVLRAVWPKVLDDRRRAREAIEADERAKRQAAQRSKRLKQMLLVAALLLAIAIALSFKACRSRLLLQQAIGAADRVATDLDQRHPERIESTDMEVVRGLKSRRDEEEIAEAWSELGRKLRAAYDSVAATYPMGDEPAATRRLLELGEVLDDTANDSIPMLQARLRYLESNLSDLSPQNQLASIDRSLREADRLGDRAFRKVLASQATALREQISSTYAQPGYALSNVTDRAQFIRAGLRKLGGGDPELVLLARTAFGRLLGASLTALGERQQLSAFLTSALPALKLLVTDPGAGSRHVLEYRTVREQLDNVRDLDELRGLRTRVASLIAEVAVRDEAEKMLLTSTLEDLFRGLDFAGRRRVWAALLGGAEAEYLFEPRRDAWPSGLRPWIEDLRSALADNKTFAAASWHAIQDIGQRTLYWSEIHDIADLTTFRYLDLETVRCYREVIGLVQNGSGSQTADQRLQNLASLAETAEEEHDRVFGASASMFAARRREVLALASRVAAAGERASERSRLLRDLGQDLNTICTTYLDSTIDGCSS